MTNSKTCARCGEEFDASDWYPTAARHDGESVELFVFCSPECRDAWEAADDTD